MTEEKIDGRTLRKVRAKKDEDRTRRSCISLTPEIHETMLRIGKENDLSFSTLIQALIVELPEDVVVKAAVNYNERTNSERKVSVVNASKQLGGISAEEVEMIRKMREGKQ